MRLPARPAALALLALLALAPAAAARSTVCTITVNSPDEREVLRQSLPPDRFEFVELVERGRRDWLDAACRRDVRCDVLVVSGHFAGTEFYSSRHDAAETLAVDEMERVQCSGGCPGLFGQLKEVYLFGCDSLKPAPVKDHGEASRDLMQRIFAGVPVIYGFAALAPYGRIAGPMLQRHLETHAPDFGSGQPSAALLRLFGPASMVATAGLEGAAALAARAASCRFHDQRALPAGRIAVLHEVLAGDPARIPGALERVEKLFATLGAEARAEPPAALALARLRADHAARGRYLALARAAPDPSLRVRLLALARALGWLAPDEHRAELDHLVADLMGAAGLGLGEVALICTLEREHRLVRADDGTPLPVAQAAASACFGHAPSRARVLAALASPVEEEVLMAQAFLRQRPLGDAAQLRELAARVAAMPASGAQVRALETLARLHIADRATLDQLARLFARSTSLAVQRAIAEVFVRAGRPPEGTAGLAEVLQRHGPGGDALIEAAIRRLRS